MLFPLFFLMCDKFVNSDRLSRHVERVQLKMLRHHREHSSKDGEPASSSSNSHSLAMMSLTAAFRVSEYSLMLLPLLFAHWLYLSECCAENHFHPVPCDEIVVDTVATANVARLRMPCLYSNNADLHLSAGSGVILYMRGNEGR